MIGDTGGYFLIQSHYVCDSEDGMPFFKRLSARAILIHPQQAVNRYFSYSLNRQDEHQPTGSTLVPKQRCRTFTPSIFAVCDRSG